MRTVTDIQNRLIALGYLAHDQADGKFGHITLDAFNHYRAARGLGPVVQTSMAELNRLLFPEDEPPVVPKPKRSNPFTDFLITNLLKGLPMFAFLTGYKTIVTGVVMVLVGAASLVTPIIGLGNIPGLDVLTPGEAWTSMSTGAGLIFLRQGLAKVGQ